MNRNRTGSPHRTSRYTLMNGPDAVDLVTHHIGRLHGSEVHCEVICSWAAPLRNLTPTQAIQVWIALTRMGFRGRPAA